MVVDLNLTNIRYDDDTVLLTISERELQHLLDFVNEKCKQFDMQINAKKTEVLVISKTPGSVTANTFLDGAPLKTMRTFVYLGSKLSADGRSHEDICSRMSQAKRAFFKMKWLLCNPKLDLGMRFLDSALLRPSHSVVWMRSRWRILEADQKLTALGMRFLRRMLRIKWNDKVSNEEVLVRAGGQRCLLNIIVKRQV